MVMKRIISCCILKLHSDAGKAKNKPETREQQRVNNNIDVGYKKSLTANDQ